MQAEAVRANIAALRKKVVQACSAAGRAPGSVRIIAAAKTFSAAHVAAALDSGVLDIGENYVQECERKICALADLRPADPPISWHLIGRLQGNKARTAARIFNWVHALDSEKTAERLSAAREGMSPINVCLQVNIDGEASKGGVAPEEALSLAPRIAALSRLRLRGLMAIPRPREPGSSAALPFRDLAALRGEIAARHGLDMDSLSMGMSADFSEAIAAGATHIRIGSAVFGPRAKPEDSARGI